MEVLEQKAACQQPETEKRTKDIHFIRSKAKEYKDKIKQMQVWNAESSVLYCQLMLGNNGHFYYGCTWINNHDAFWITLQTTLHTLKVDPFLYHHSLVKSSKVRIMKCESFKIENYIYVAHFIYIPRYIYLHVIM